MQAQIEQPPEHKHQLQEDFKGIDNVLCKRSPKTEHYLRHLSAEPAMAGAVSAGLSPDRIERASFTHDYNIGEGEGESRQCVICIAGQSHEIDRHQVYPSGFDFYPIFLILCIMGKVKRKCYVDLTPWYHKQKFIDMQ